jgi:hypothetical protein
VNIEDLDRTEVARVLGVGRVMIGVAFLLMPRRAMKMWTGDDATSAAELMSARSLGARDLALGAGLLKAIENDQHVEDWLFAGAVADLSDAVGVVSNFGRLGALRRVLFLATAGAAAYVGFKLTAE